MKLVETIFVDTSIFLRFFVADLAEFYDKAKNLFAQAESGRIKLITSELVIAEIVWVLESYYDFRKEEIAEVIESLIFARSLKVINADMIREAIKLYLAANVDFIDAYNICLLNKKGIKKIATFDKKHFRKLSGVELVKL